MSALTTAIGSLPHLDISQALDYSFRHDLPFLPQLPARNPLESILAQGLDLLPGLMMSEQGPIFSPQRWKKSSYDFYTSLSADLSFSWEKIYCCAPLFFEQIDQKKISHLKLQFVGPLSCLVFLSHHQLPPDEQALLTKTIEKLLFLKISQLLVLAQKTSAHIYLCLDEPLFFQAKKRDHYVLSNLLNNLKAPGIDLGLHCCHHGDFSLLSDFSLDFFSFDAHLFCSPLPPTSFQLWPGLVSPENKHSPVLDFPQAPVISASCGLALQSPDRCEEILRALIDLSRNQLLAGKDC